MKVDLPAGDQFSEAPGIALLLTGQAAGAERVEIAGEQLVRRASLAQFRLQLAPHGGGRRDAHLLTDDGAQQRLIARLPHARQGIADTRQRSGKTGFEDGDRIQAFAQLFRGGDHALLVSGS